MILMLACLMLANPLSLMQLWKKEKLKQWILILHNRTKCRVVGVPDSRLKVLSDSSKSQKSVPAWSKAPVKERVWEISSRRTSVKLILIVDSGNMTVERAIKIQSFKIPATLIVTAPSYRLLEILRNSRPKHSLCSRKISRN